MTPKRSKPTERSKPAARSKPTERSKPVARSKPARKTPARAATKKVQLPAYQPDDSIKKALAVVAHPDDVDFGMAGTIATLTSQGVDVTYCLVTSGDAGGDELVMEKEARAKLREDEQRKAAACVGVSDLVFLGYPDGMVEPTLALRRDLARVIRQVRPDVVLTQSAERNYERIYASHPDHLATGEATLRAVYPDARNPHAFPGLLQDEGLEPHKVPQVWVGGTVAPTLVVDTTASIDKKIEALKQHRSQLGDGAHIDSMIREWGATIARTAGLPKGRTAEAFRVVSTV